MGYSYFSSATPHASGEAKAQNSNEMRKSSAEIGAELIGQVDQRHSFMQKAQQVAPEIKGI
jgi:hypothetical protein